MNMLLHTPLQIRLWERRLENLRFHHHLPDLMALMAFLRYLEVSAARYGQKLGEALNRTEKNGVDY